MPKWKLRGGSPTKSWDDYLVGLWLPGETRCVLKKEFVYLNSRGEKSQIVYIIRFLWVS